MTKHPMETVEERIQFNASQFPGCLLTDDEGYKVCFADMIRFMKDPRLGCVNKCRVMIHLTHPYKTVNPLFRVVNVLSLDLLL
ncbi:MAG: hypothetical protein QXQ02_10055 [Halobacteria archaeon]